MATPEVKQERSSSPYELSVNERARLAISGICYRCSFWRCYSGEILEYATKHGSLAKTLVPEISEKINFLKESGADLAEAVATVQQACNEINYNCKQIEPIPELIESRIKEIEEALSGAGRPGPDSAYGLCQANLSLHQTGRTPAESLGGGR